MNNAFFILKFHTKISIVIVGICLTLFSCNNSFTILNRKYRQGYSFSFSSNKPKDKTSLKIENGKNKIKSDSLIDESESRTFSSSNNSEPLIINVEPNEILFVCDTPPKKETIEPWSLYKPKEPKSNHSTGKRLEPFNLASILAIILTIALGGIIGVGVVVFLLLIYALNIISLIRIKRNPNKFRKFSKILAIILLALFGIPLLVILILLLASIA